MNHKEAMDQELAVKYVLGELPAVQRDEYEDHYIDCPECAKELHVAAAFADAAREVFRQKAQGETRAQSAQGQVRRGWFAWLRPVVAMPALAALLAIIAYQNAVTIPEAKKAAGREVASQNPMGSNPSDKAVMQASLSQDTASQGAGMKAVLVGAAFPLHALGGRRGEDAGTAGTSEGDNIQVQPGENFALRLDFTPKQVFDSYVAKLADSSGREVFRLPVSGSSTNKTLQLAIAGGALKPGTYSLVFAGGPRAKGLGNGAEVLRYRFSIAFRQ